jgi:hypothetical protein
MNRPWLRPPLHYGEGLVNMEILRALKHIQLKVVHENSIIICVGA